VGREGRQTAALKAVVTDTGPLLHLHQAGGMELLAYLGEVHITPVVWNELPRHTPSFRTRGYPVWLKLSHPSAAAALQAAQWGARVLDAGEAEALAYAQETQADLFLTDDTAARTLGESLGMHVRGSLGVILFAATSGHLDHAGCSKVLTNLELKSIL
jgi:predicted nucleic acid-binding protein